MHMLSSAQFEEAKTYAPKSAFQQQCKRNFITWLRDKGLNNKVNKESTNFNQQVSEESCGDH